MPELLPTAANTRAPCDDVMKRAGDSVSAFAVEQEYTLLPQAAAAVAPVSGCDTNSGSAATAAGGWPHLHLPNPMEPFLLPPSMLQGKHMGLSEQTSDHSGGYYRSPFCHASLPS